jgi:hypothetical protein
MQTEAWRDRGDRPFARAFEGLYCRMLIRQPAAGLVVVTIEGSDIGEFGDAPFRELEVDLRAGKLLELFIDGRDTRGASIEVSNDWAFWLAKHRKGLRHVTMLTGSRFIQITADFVRRFAALEDLMRITNDPATFDAALAQATRERSGGAPA